MFLLPPIANHLLHNGFGLMQPPSYTNFFCSIDKMAFKVDKPVTAVKDYPIDAVYGKLLKKGPEEYEDVKGLVTADYQEELEKAWVATLRKKYPVQVNQEVVKTVNKH